MAIADENSVRGDFGNVRFEYGRFFAEFSRRDGRYFVTTNDLPRVPGVSNAATAESTAQFVVQYTFGFDPLQQYLVETQPGTLQALNVAWSADASNPGWFDLYAGEALTADDPLHWGSELHNWNSRCASCHVTEYEKNYEPAIGAFASTHAIDNVACEACHGPGSLHASTPSVAMPTATAIDSQWTFADGPIAARGSGSDAAAVSQVEACAACHSRRAQLAPHAAGVAYLDAFEPVWLTEGLYHADGQILDEVFVYGSFLQSRMHAAGVACSDCHEPHSGALRASGDALCATCHRADVFAVEAHHRHQGAAAIQCVDCHMPATTYMTVDPRRDHSFRVPRPDLSQAIGVPNACNGCHRDTDPAWAQAAIAQWYPQGRWLTAHYGEALDAGRSWSADRRARLLELVYDDDQPAIVAGTAVRLLARQLDGGALDAIEFAARSAEPLLQLAALQSLDDAGDDVRIRVAQRFLDHESMVMRVNAARALLPVGAQLSTRRQSDLDAAVSELATTLAYNADTSEGQVGLGLLAERTGDEAAARDAYEAAIAANPAFAAGWINLADLLRRSGDEAQANALLLEALQGGAREDPALYAATGLSHVRLGETEQALAALALAAETARDDPYHTWAYGLALASIRTPQTAIDYLESAAERFPGYAPILFALATMNRDYGETDAARVWTQRLLEVSPGDAQGIALQRELEALR